MKGETRNIETFKVGSGNKMNKFDFHKHQGEMREAHAGPETDSGTNRSETKAEKVARLTKEAHEKVLRRKKRR
jgi:hypothetical protein